MTRPGPSGGAGWYRAVDTVTTQNVPATSTWTQQIALGAAGLNMGYAKFYIPQAASDSDHRRICGSIFFTDDVDDGFVDSGDYYSYIFHNYTPCTTTTLEGKRQQGFLYSTDAVLSEDALEESGFGIQMKSVRINGSNLDIVWENPNGGAGSLSVVVEARATTI